MSAARKSVSVCMATYRGAAYVAEEIESMLPQLRGGDEVVVSDDGPDDGTRAIVEGFAASGAPVRLVEYAAMADDGPVENVVHLSRSGAWKAGTRKAGQVLSAIRYGAAFRGVPLWLPSF